MVEVIWAHKALQQINEIAEYIAVDSSFHAKRVAKKITSITDRLSVFPEMGAVVPEFRDEALREVRVYSYRIIYRYAQKPKCEIHILGVVHGMRLLDNNDTQS